MPSPEDANDDDKKPAAAAAASSPAAAAVALLQRAAASSLADLKAPPPVVPALPPFPTAAAGATAAGAPNVGHTPESALEQRQLAEFNQWLFRWNNYQQHLAHYWQGRYHALQSHTLDRGGAFSGVPSLSDAVAAAGGGKQKRSRKRDGGAKVDKAQMKWNMRYQELVEFMHEHGHVNVPKEFTYKYSPPLGHWVGRMRYLHRNGKLEESREQRLKDIGFEFIIEKTAGIKFSVVWDKSYQALKAFRDMNGHVEVPNAYKPQPDMAELDGWITRQRKHFRDGKLPDHLKVKIVELGINLGGRGRPFGIETEDIFSQNYKALAEYAAEHGDADVPEKYDEDRELGKWVKGQREAYGDGMLPDDRVSLLNQIGFNFYHGRKTSKTKAIDPWDRRISELKAYKDKTGNCNVPKKFTLNLGLGDFVYNQRMAKQDNKLSEDKIKDLDELGFDWEKPKKVRSKKNKTMWDVKFDDLVEYKEKHGDLNIPVDYEPNPALHKWIKRQRKYHREGQMKDDKTEKLKGIGFNFGGPKQQKKPWEEQFEAMAEFKVENGHLDIPVIYKPNPQLYYWIGTQKQTYKKGNMSEERINKLESIGFDFSFKPRDRKAKRATRGGNRPFLDPEEFEKMVGELKAYKEEHGDVDVAQRAGRLGSFVHYMRFYVKGGKLAQEQIDRLTEIGFSWNVVNDRWNSKFEMLAKFKADNNHFDIPSGHTLYSWAQYQRKLYFEDGLSPENMEKLSSINFDFDTEPRGAGGATKAAGKTHAATWNEHFEELEEFKEEHGNAEVPSVYNTNPSLAKWAATQRVKYKKGNLKDAHLDRLNEIGFNLPATESVSKRGALKVPQLQVNRESYLEDLWDNSYQELVAYANHFGHCNIPISYDANPALGAWAFSQRMAFKKDKLSEDRIEKLNEIGFKFPGEPNKTIEV